MNIDYITAYISLGSNVGDRAGNLLLAIRGMMEASLEVRQISPIFETEPWDMECDMWFLNMVAEVRIDPEIKPTQVMARLLRLEYILGRREKLEKKPRTIDLDLLLYGGNVMETEFLTLPHPRMHLRRFVLTPLADIAGHLYHPKLHQFIGDLLAACPDSSDVRRWNPADVGPQAASLRES